MPIPQSTLKSTLIDIYLLAENASATTLAFSKTLNVSLPRENGGSL
jgi:hypothetical protein